MDMTTVNFGKVLDNMLTHEEKSLLDEIMIEDRRVVEERKHVECLKKAFVWTPMIIAIF